MTLNPQRPALVLSGLAAAGALVVAAAPIPAETIERLYTEGAYRVLQPAVTAVSSLLPVSFLDLAVVGLLLGAAGVLWRARMRRRSDLRGAGGVRLGRLRTIAGAAGWILVLGAILYLWFLLFWGLNYRRVPLERKLAYDASRVTPGHALEFGRTAVAQLNALADSPAPDEADDRALAGALAAVERALGSKAHARVAAPKRSLLTWYFRYAAIDGMTDPFFLEIILNPDLLPFERPFVLAHEWAHLAGYADESEANFVAWLACIRGTPATRYSGWLAAYEHVNARLPRAERAALAATLNARSAADLRAAYERFQRSSRAVRTAARGAYDTYLRANRVEEGVASYGAVVRLMLGTEFDAGWTPRLGGKD